MPTLQAIVLDGSAALPHIAACTSMGRLALLSDNKTKVRLAHDAREEAVTALALEPSNDLAHHLMGRWHFEMANLNVVVRTLVRVMYGTALASGTDRCCQRGSLLSATALLLMCNHCPLTPAAPCCACLDDRGSFPVFAKVASSYTCRQRPVCCLSTHVALV